MRRNRQRLLWVPCDQDGDTNEMQAEEYSSGGDHHGNTRLRRKHACATTGVQDGAEGAARG